MTACGFPKLHLKAPCKLQWVIQGQAGLLNILPMDDLVVVSFSLYLCGLCLFYLFIFGGEDMFLETQVVS